MDYSFHLIVNHSKGTRILDGKNMWHVEVAGSPSVALKKHTIDDAKKSLHTDLFNLVAIF
jgi:hypothetical protein